MQNSKNTDKTQNGNTMQNPKNMDKTENGNTMQNPKNADKTENGNAMQNSKNTDKTENGNAMQSQNTNKIEYKSAYSNPKSTDRNSLTDDEIKVVEEKLRRDILSLLDKCDQKNVDIFSLNDKFYQRFGNKWNKNTDNYLEKISKEIKIDVKIV
jgi:hypothetical protein